MQKYIVNNLYIRRFFRFTAKKKAEHINSSVLRIQFKYFKIIDNSLKFSTKRNLSYRFFLIYASMFHNLLEIVYKMSEIIIFSLWAEISSLYRLSLK